MRTRGRLRDALVSLVLERGWDAVTVVEVCERAGVGRSTLYAHFADKEELLFSGFDNVAAALEKVRAASPGEFAFARPFIEHAQGDRPLFRALVVAGATRRVIDRLRAVSKRLVDAELSHLAVPLPRRELLSRYVSGSLVELMVAWLEGSLRGRASDLAGDFVELTRRILR